MLELIAAAHADAGRQAPRRLQRRALPCEVETRSDLLLDCPRDEAVDTGAEHARFAEGAQHAVLRESISDGRGRSEALQMKTDAREEVDRARRAEQIAAAEVDEGARGELELLACEASRLLAAHDAQAPFDPSAEPEGRRLRLLHRDQQIPPRVVAVPNLRELGGAAE